MKQIDKFQKYLIKNKIDIFIINRTDEFLNEYIASYAERLNWISNFSGSAGRAIIFQSKAFLFVDGRYTLQASKEVNKKSFKILHLGDYWSFLKTKLNKKKNIAIDPKHHSINEVENLKKILIKKKQNLLFLNKNPIDICWENQPLYPKKMMFNQDKKYAGKSTKNKIINIQNILLKKQIDIYILTSLDSIAWLLNIRGKDIKYTPLALCYLIITCKGKVALFADPKKVTIIKNKLINISNFYPFTGIEKYIAKLNKKKIMGMDKNETSHYFKDICFKYSLKVKYFDNPCLFLKAQKNKIEISGAKNANLRDGVSITKFLFWLKNRMIISKTNEIKAANYLSKLRKKNKLFYSLSFETISAINDHAAIPHYRVNKKSNKNFKKNCIYLCDSGGQYFDGTTDITRTIIVGKATKEQKDRFTRVLKGHIALATAEFSFKKNSSSLDYLARKSLNEIKCDYDHGTGHGIGSFLSVHEGPQRIAKLTNNKNNILPGMIVSNEPGYYKKNEYGIRIENLLICMIKNNKTLYFENISWAPIDIDLIEKSLLSSKEKEWLNHYHKLVRKKMNSYLSSDEKKWLYSVTEPI